MNVYDAAIKRIGHIFSEFDNVCVSFSGGKDSGVLLNLCIDYIRKNNINRRIGVFHMDYEAQYQMTTDYVIDTLSKNNDIIDVYHCCIPFKVTTCTSMHQAFWRPWEDNKKDIWVRDKPANSFSYKDFEFYKENMMDYDFQIQFGKWLHNKNKANRTCCLVGIRTQESLNRWRTIYSDRNFNKFDGNKWTTKMFDNVYNAYPIFDWTTEDVWIANARNGWTYNKLYDLYYMAGLNVDQMRVASPFISEGLITLKLYRVIDPNNWAKMIGRVNGVNFTGIYGGTTAMGWKSLKLPEGHTWESFMYFLLSSLPAKTRKSYILKLETSIKFWREKGGVLSKDIIKKLKNAGIDIKILSSTNYRTTKVPVKMEYIDEIDIKEFKELPSYKRMCICIMKNDHLCKYMGFSQTKNEIAMRKNIIKKYQNLL